MAFTMHSLKKGNITIPLWGEKIESRYSEEDNKFTVLIGRNGTGKSNLLSVICKMLIKIESFVDVRYHSFTTFIEFEDSLESYNMVYTTEGRKMTYIFKDKRLKYGNWQTSVLDNSIVLSEKIIKPRKLISTTVSPFDKFPVLKKRYWEIEKFDDSDSIYHYLGMKNYFGQVSNSGQISRVIEALINALATKHEANWIKLVQIFSLLGFEARVVVDYRLKRYSDIHDRIGDTIKSGAELKELYAARYLYNDVRYGRAFIEEKPIEFFQQMYDSLLFIKKYAIRKSITIALDFSVGEFVSGSNELYKKLAFLRKFDLVRQGNVVLHKKNVLPFEESLFNISEASSGEQSFILTFLGIAAEIENNSLILIDEPEISLHPEWQEKFVPLLKDTFAEYKGCHFILATHSPLILAQAGSCNGYVVKMDDMSIEPLSDFSMKSADYQLAVAFETPGYQNEYLARQALSALRLINLQKIDSIEMYQKIEILRRARKHLIDSDPVSHLIDTVIKVVDSYEQ